MTYFILLAILLFLLILGFVGFYFLYKPDNVFFRALVKKERQSFLKSQRRNNRNRQISRRVMIERSEHYTLFFPKMLTGEEKIVVSIHGGHFTTGNKDTNDFFNAEVSKEGFILIALEYPLVPEAGIKQILQELETNLEEAIHALKSRLGPIHEIFLLADGAGAYLSIYLSAIYRSQQVARLFQVHPMMINIKAMALISGYYYLQRNDSKKKNIAIHVWKENWKNIYREYTNIDYVIKRVDLPPMYLFTCQNDSVRSHSQNLFKSCRSAGKHVYYKKYINEALEHSFQIQNSELEETKDTIVRITKFFDR